MYSPHIVTLYNMTVTTDPDTFEDVTVNNITILQGVFLEARKATNVIRSGLEGADAVSLYIPFDVTATDAQTGAQKTFASPMVYWASEDKSGLWTLTTDKNTFFVKGVAVEDMSEEAINLLHDGVYTVTKVDEKDFGRPHMRHWEVGGS